ncbi:MAG: CPBP family intramembrane metalloprotease [Deltaproteobacteria bacterium]|nr:MAG: CPBP family intramembrane metalloprotease [Deltaproteobacteria bacterium]
MRPSMVRAIARKELRETLRDRKNLFLIVFVPILLYPALLLLVTQVALVQSQRVEEADSRVLWQNAEPDHPLLRALAETERIRLVHRDEVDAPLLGRAAEADVWIDLGGVPADLAERMDSALVEIRFSSVDDHSRRARDRVRAAVEEWRQEVLLERLARAELPEEFAAPAPMEIHDVADRAARGGHFLAALLPLLVVMTVLLGATYPAIDVTVGERERGTLQTLLTAPVRITEILAGKYLAVLVIALITGTANLASLALLFGQNLLLGGDFLEEIDFAIPLPTLAVLLWTIVLVGVFIAAALLCSAAFARSYKEAQTWVMPVFLLCIIPGVLAQLPGVEYSPAMALVPAVNVILLMKLALAEGAPVDALLLVTGASFAWAGLGLQLAARLYSQERILLGGQGRFQLFTSRREIAPTATPAPGEALALTAIAFVLLFYVGGVLQSRLGLPGVALSLVLVLAVPALAAAWYLRCDFRDTFALRAPGWRPLAASVLLGASLWVLLLFVGEHVLRHVLEPPDHMLEEFAHLLRRPETVWGVVGLFAAVAVAPAVTEELLFRGFLLSGLRDRLRDGAAVAVTAVVFGLFHMSVYRFPGTVVLGVVLAVLVIRGRSLLPAMVFHLLNNGILVAVMLWSDGGELEWPAWSLAVAVAATVAGFALLRNEGSAAGEGGAQARAE